MSRNNVIVVASANRRYYVLPNLNADTQWNEDSVREQLPSARFTANWGRALVLAHKIQRRIDTEYGVRMMYL